VGGHIESEIEYADTGGGELLAADLHDLFRSPLFDGDLVSRHQGGIDG
jgi:hypothetical protein